MSFTPAQLAAQLSNPDLQKWASSTLSSQTDLIPAFISYYNNIQPWINSNGGNGSPFGWDNLAGLESNGQQVSLNGPAQRAPFNDAFNDIRAHMGTPGFRLFQAATAIQRLIQVLQHM